MKFAKVMSLHLSVTHSVHGGGVSRPTPGGGEVEESGQGGSPGPHPVGEVEVSGQGEGVSRPTPRERLGVWPGELPSAHLGDLQAHTQEDMCIPACTVADNTPPPPADSYCCRWYASYWNAFLYFFILKKAL